ncbi:hypothetical protein [Cellulomonas endophytica]|uniref:hypothetical protein n=1 Tax=Cellulomonas endophytica TaxID=2494735 RepID=UPI001012908C|nr:hypothetical protein [Cellulomonas endophytica]
MSGPAPGRTGLGALVTAATATLTAAAALAAVGAAVFGTAIVSRPALSLAEDTDQLLLAWGLGTLGLFSVGALLVTATRVLVPQVVTLYDLGEAFDRRLADAAAREHYLLGHPTVPSFQRGLADRRRAARHVEAELVGARSALAEAERATDAAATATAAARVRELDDARALHHADLAVWERARAVLVADAQATTVRAETRAALVAAGVFGLLAAAGGVGFQLALSSSDDGTAGGGTDPALVTTTMTRLAGATGDALWERLDLAACELGGVPGVVYVALDGGTGTPADPWTVQTVPVQDRCLPRRFEATRDAAAVVVVEAAVVTAPPSSAG